jgi:hypothetical protein
MNELKRVGIYDARHIIGGLKFIICNGRIMKIQRQNVLQKFSMIVKLHISRGGWRNEEYIH